MRILYCGDVVGRSGRQAVLERLGDLKARLKPDVVVVNVENSAHGFGVTAKMAEEFLAAGAQALTTGNHVWDQRDIIAYIETEPRLVRPLNYPRGTPGKGYALIDAGRGRTLLVTQLMGRLFMDALDDPFAGIDELLSRHRLGANLSILVDIHAEASSEKMSVAHFLDGRVSAVIGTHSHIPTADGQILPGGTAYQTDIGMCGDYDSVIGMNKSIAIAKFTRKMPTEKLAPAEGVGTLCAVLIDTDDATGLAKAIRPLRLGGRLAETMPE
ncbi:MAG: YmdB family metallophosphoesterase [Rhodospirillales bacterium]|nr:YmdB family metallophosphoesterase [Rhodospirillales bacterium]